MKTKSQRFVVAGYKVHVVHHDNGFTRALAVRGARRFYLIPGMRAPIQPDMLHVARSLGYVPPPKYSDFRPA
jgi:hypothetical protein